DFFTRFSDSAGLLMIMTRWHVEDPVGRFMERLPEAKILRYPALAEEDEKNRLKGEPLFPQHKSLPFLLERRAVMTQAAWESEYQQSPIVPGGGIFPVDKLVTLPLWDRTGLMRSVRYWDKASGAADRGGAYTAGVLMHMTKEKRFVISHVVRGNWSALERENQIKAWAQADRTMVGYAASYEVGIEQEPGSGGKESADATIRNLAGYRVFADRVTGSKEVRAEPFAAQLQGGNLFLVAGQWCRALLDEMEAFPHGKYRDQVDACSGAFNRLVAATTYDIRALAS